MEAYIKNWFTIIQNMSNDNTYKLAWGRAIVEHALNTLDTSDDDQIEISFNSIAHNILKYYWNQIFFFNLMQSPNRLKLPIIYQIVVELIEYYKVYASSMPVWFNKAEEFFKEHNSIYELAIHKIAHTLKQDVSWRFLYANKINHNIYSLNERKTSIYIKREDFIVLKKYGEIMIQLINYKWAQLLEKFNRSPKIVSKIKGSQDNVIRRSSLIKYKEILLKQFKDNQVTDFYSGLIINPDEQSIDHVIPWSFMFSDDIWNLVITSKSNNSRKSNHHPSREDIERLKLRNLELIKVIEESKLKEEILLSIEHDYLTRYYFDLIA